MWNNDREDKVNAAPEKEAVSSAGKINRKKINIR